MDEKSFSENRVDSALKRIEGALEKAAQNRLDSFFTVKKQVVSSNPVKEKVIEEKNFYYFEL